MAKGKGPGRPRLETTVHTFNITLSLREAEDDDLIAFFARHPPRQRARAVVTALRRSTHLQREILTRAGSRRPIEPAQGDETGW